MEQQIVVFNLNNENYGVTISTVESIIKMQAITRVPHSPHYVEGVTNLRGKVIPVIDLNRRFDLPVVEQTNGCRIIIVNIKKDVVGMVVDAVSEVLTISDGDIEPPPQISMTIHSSFISGIARLDDRLIILLDLDQIIAGK